MATVIDEPATESKLPDHYEVVNGEIVELPPMSFYAREVANILNSRIDRYLATTDVGRSRVEMLFRIPQPDDPGRNRQPDAVYVSYDRWPKNRRLPIKGAALDVVPDVAVEVVSPGDQADDLLDKVREYLRGGVRLVWVVYPTPREVHAYLPDGQVRVFLPTHALTADDILPGFSVPVAELFPEPEDPPAGA